MDSTVCNYKNQCESTYLSQSPIGERIYDENQDFNKSLLEDYNTILTITEENDMKFYNENKIPKLIFLNFN